MQNEEEDLIDQAGLDQIALAVCNVLQIVFG
jgi:hypothetical protein